MTQKQHDATMRAFVRDWKMDGGTRCDKETEEMYRMRCETSGIDYAEFCEARQRKSKWSHTQSSPLWEAKYGPSKQAYVTRFKRAKAHA